MTSILVVSVPDPSELEAVQATTMLTISLVRLGMVNTFSSADQRLDLPGDGKQDQWENGNMENSPESPSTVHL